MRRVVVLAGVLLSLALVAFASIVSIDRQARPDAVAVAIAAAPSAPRPIIAATVAASAIPTSVPTLVPTLAPPTPTPRRTVPRVGVQVGHWKSSELPDELARLRTSAGASAGGVREVDVNLDIAQRVVALLQARGYDVDLIPATVPPSYDADAFVAIHADGSTSARPRGFKMATPWRTSDASQALLDSLTTAYAATTGLPQDDAITFNMRGYYAFSYRRHIHASAKTTPAVIIETGYLTNAADRAFLLKRAQTVAAGIDAGIARYLAQRDPNDLAALVPPDFPVFRPATDGVVVRAAPSEKARALIKLTTESRIFVFRERDGWFEAVVRGEWRTVGWIQRADLVATDDPQPTPPPASDS